MKKLWLLFSQVATVLLAVWFVLVTLKPEWLNQRNGFSSLSLSQVTDSSANESAQMSSPGSFSLAAKKASPAVVSISTSKAAEKGMNKNDPWQRFFFGDREEAPTAGLGSGVIVSPEGYILTNYHVVEEADEIEVSLNDGRKTKAKIIGVDPDSDLAVLKIKLDNLPVIVLGKSEKLQVGDQVLAIGNPFGVGQTVTGGIVSALGRNQLGLNTFENFIQTDAAINPGNSGGALVDVSGNLMGINTAIFSRSGGSMGIGFAIPVSTAQQVLEGIVRDGQVTRGWIGVEPTDLTPELMQSFEVKNTQGVAITGVLQNGPAAKAGIKPGDVIVQVGPTPVAQVAELLSAVAALKPNQSVQDQKERSRLGLGRDPRSATQNQTPHTSLSKVCRLEASDQIQDSGEKNDVARGSQTLFGCALGMLAIQRLLPQRTSSGGQKKDRFDPEWRHSLLGFDRTSHRAKSRCASCAPWPLLEKPKWRGDRMDEDAVVPIVGSRHQLVCLPLAFGCTPNAWQQRTTRCCFGA